MTTLIHVILVLEVILTSRDVALRYRCGMNRIEGYPKLARLSSTVTSN
uniref:Uncharacterized protein n=1 Tax=Vitis vinifera TaxID=29760 RepID=F6H576_VITVI